MKRRIVGLTGGIGSGKSAAAECFARLGAAVVDTDAIAHELTWPEGAALPAIRRAFGEAIVSADGSLDRAEMRRRVFADAAERQRLEAILHPMIRAESDRRCDKALADGAPYVVLVVPLLVESGSYRERVGRIAVVDCDDELRIARVMLRNGLPRDEVERIIAAQASRADRLALADDVIDNSGNLDDLASRVASLHARYSRDLAGIRPAG